MNKKRKWIRAWVIYPIGIVVVIICIYIIFYCCFQTATTVLLVRHAEKASEPGGDPPLSTEGIIRAQTLVHVVGKADVTVIFATQYIRAQQTVQPTADHFGLIPNQYNAMDVEGLIDLILANHTGEIVLVVGHSNTVPQIIEELGGGPVSPIAESEYDNLFVITVFRWGGPKVMHLKYGEPS